MWPTFWEVIRLTPETYIGVESVKMPNKTYCLDMLNKRINGYINDDIEAVKQAVYLILRIERYDYIIFSHNYGIELKDLFGRERLYVTAMLSQRIREALMADNRVRDVKDFNFNIKKGGIYSVSFTVVSIYGDFEQEASFSV